MEEGFIRCGERRPDSRPMTALAMARTLRRERERRKVSSRTSLAMSWSDTASWGDRGARGAMGKESLFLDLLREPEVVFSVTLFAVFLRT